MEAVIVGIILLIGAAALWHYGMPNPVILLAVVALAIVGAILLVIGLVELADHGVHAAMAAPGGLVKAMRGRRQRVQRLQKMATGLRQSRERAVRFGGRERVSGPVSDRTGARLAALGGSVPGVDGTNGYTGRESRLVRKARLRQKETRTRYSV